MLQFNVSSMSLVSVRGTCFKLNSLNFRLLQLLDGTQ